MKPSDLPAVKTDRPLNAATFRNLVAWNIKDYKSLFTDSPFLQKLGWPERSADSDFSLWEGSDVVIANGTFDFFAAPMPQAQSSKIVFATHRDGNAEIYSMDADGNNQIRLTNNSYNDENPRWSPNGAKILFQSDRDNPETGNYDIYVMNADGTGQTRLTFDAADDCNAIWSPDGSKIAFQSLRNGSYYQVYVMNADGTSQANVTNGIAPDTQPSWSPDGTKLAFASERDHAGRSSIYAMNANGTNQTRLTFTSDPFCDEQPVWSRDGSKLAFVSTRDSIIETWQDTDDDGNILNRSAVRTNKEVYVMNADGSSQLRLTNTLELDDAPYWSPDGTKIIFRSDRERDCCDPTPQLWIMNADGSNQGLLTSNAYSDYSPSWTVTGNQPPVANAGGPYTAMTGQTVQFNGSGSFDPDGTITSYLWNFGDNTSGSGVSPSHVYTSIGTYTVTLTVTDNLWSQATATTTATITNQPPVANAGGPYSAMTSQAVQFNGNGSFDPDGSITSYAWNFGDNTSGSGISPTHAYASVGTYTVTLTVTDNLGSQANATTSATITSTQPPVANAGGPYSGNSGQAVQFNGGGSFDPDGSITSYAWTFGDNTSGSGVSPTHAYNSVGNYTVTLTVTDNLGLQASATTTANIGTNSMEQYAANFSQWALLRQPNSNESTYWNDIFRAAYQNGQGSLVLATREFGRTVFESSEYAARSRSDRDYVYDLYKTYLMREPDQQGWDNWTSVVPSYGREHVRRGFDESTEFLNLMSTMTANGSITSAVSSLSSARVEPKNQPGNGLLARDAEWSLSLLSLPGRAGLDLGLSLSYSSQVWTRSGPYLYFDEDIGFPSPGFRLSFPTIQEKFFDAQVGKNAYVMIMSSGRRVELRQVGTSNVYEAGDSSYLQLIDNGSLLVRSTDGTQLTYGWYNHEFRCNQIKDRNGNYLTINYNWLGDITTITDTLGRTITFNYDPNQNPISITQSWTVSGIPQTHTWATFGWGTHTMASGFSGVSVVGAPNGYTLPVLTQVGLHDGSRYNFEYTGAGQVNLIRRFTSDNVQRAYTAFVYDTPANVSPRLSATRVWAENWTGINGVPNEVVTQYSELGDGSHQLVAPDGTIYKEFYGGTGSSPAWQRGLVAQSEVWSAGVRQKWTTLNWTQDNEAVNYQTNPRVIESNVYDASGNRRRTSIDYQTFTLPSGTSCSLPSDTREYAAEATTVLRRAHTDYRMDPVADTSYLSRHIIGLVKEQSLFEVNGGTETLQSKVGFQYDETSSIQGTDTPVGHDNSFDGNFVIGRGNLTSVKRYDVINSGQWTVSSMQYNTAGAVVSTKDPLNHQATISYADSFSANGTNLDAPRSFTTLAFPTTITDADGFSSHARYHYDLGARTRIEGPPPENQPQGAIQVFAYDGAGRLDRVTTANNGAYTRFVYGPDYVQSFTTVNTVADEAYAFQVFDGAGRLRVAGRNHPGSVGGYSAQESIFDSMGRAVKQSNPTEINGAWMPTGDDAAGWLYTLQSYNWQGRPLITTNTDGTTKEASYSGCGCAGGEVVTLTDEGTLDAGVFKRRQQKIYSDILGRTVKTELLNWQGGSIYSTTVNTYNARDQVTLVRQYEGSQGSGTYQDTTMTYDGYGRMKTKHVPEQNAGVATTWDYNPDDTIQKVTDARGSVSNFSYNARHLVTGTTYDPSSGITDTPDASFGYDAAGNLTSMTDGSGSVSYHFNQLSRLTSETRQFNGLGGIYAASYAYNLAGDLKTVAYPNGATIDYGLDTTGQTTSVTGSLYAGVTQYITDITYRAFGQRKKVFYGNDTQLELSYTARLQLQKYNMKSYLFQGQRDDTALVEHQYEADGNLRYAHDMMDEKFDRAYRYDHVGRLKEAYSGFEARQYVNQPSSSAWGPYRQVYQYGAFDDMTGRASQFWSQSDSFTTSYVNGRNQDPLWQYDANGGIRFDKDLEYKYDASGTNVSVRALSDNKTLTQTVDGDGELMKRGDGFAIHAVYYMRSTMLEGKILTEIDSQGNWLKNHVYLDGETLARQINGPVAGGNSEVLWRHENPLTGSRGETPAQGFYERQIEPDTMGVNVGFEDPWMVPPEPPTDPDLASLYVGSASGECRVEGIIIHCAAAYRLLASGSAAQCPNNDCNPRFNGREWEHIIFTDDGLLYAPNVKKKKPPRLKVLSANERRAVRQMVKERGRNPYNVVSEDEEVGFNEQVIGDLVGTALAKPDCVKFYTTILQGVSNKDNPVLEGGDLSKIFQRFLKEGRFTRKVAAGAQGPANAHASGGFGTKGGPVIHLYDRGGDIYFMDAYFTVGELFHEAGSRGLYSDQALSEAIRNSPYRSLESELEPKGNIYNDQYANAKKETKEEAYSYYFHAIQQLLCFVKRPTSRPYQRY